MAVRDRNQFAWQAYVITMSIVSVGLLLGMFFMWRSASDLSKKLASTQDQLTTATSQATSNNSKIELLRAMLGYGAFSEEDMESMLGSYSADADLAEVVTDYEAAMKFFAPGVAANEKNLLKLPTYLLETVRARNEDIEAARKEVNKLTADLKQHDAEFDSKLKAAEAARNTAVTELAEARDQHAKMLAQVDQQRKDTIAQFEAYKKLLDDALASTKSELANIQAANDRLSDAVANLTDELNEYRQPDFAAPQGRIVRVGNGGTNVWIDLGSEAGLREGVPFSVIDESSVNISEAKPKAHLTITRVIDAHLSVAKVLDPDYRNIVLTEDKVYSPAWRPGRKVGFALVGMMDINDDGKDDIDQVREMIRMAGGKIDAEKLPKGGETGPGMDYNTSWLVLGTDLNVPVDASDELRAQLAEKAKEYADFIRVGRQNGVQQISLDKLMGYLKTKSSDRTVPLGNRVRGEDFPVSPGGSFSPRFPPK